MLKLQDVSHIKIVKERREKFFPAIFVYLYIFFYQLKTFLENSLKGLTNINTGKNELIKNCDQNCENCDTSTGTCLSCKNGMFLNNNSSNNVCMSCPANATCNGVSLACKAGYYKNANSCSACPAGYYTSSGKCVPCPQGTFNPKPAQSNAVACIPCRPGILFIKRSCQLFRLSGGNLFQRKRSLRLHTMPCQCHLRKWKLFM